MGLYGRDGIMKAEKMADRFEEMVRSEATGHPGYVNNINATTCLDSDPLVPILSYCRDRKLQYKFQLSSELPNPPKAKD